MAVRVALVSSPSVNVDVVRRYLPSNYTAVAATNPRRPSEQIAVVIVGEDHAGWTLDGYVIPRLASGMIYVHELKAEEV